MRPPCPVCGQDVVSAAGSHSADETPQNHTWINSHTCRENDGLTFAACACGDSAWGKDADEAIAKMGGWRG